VKCALIVLAVTVVYAGYIWLLARFCGFNNRKH
jgi:hypothetical protein